MTLCYANNTILLMGGEARSNEKGEPANRRSASGESSGRFLAYGRAGILVPYFALMVAIRSFAISMWAAALGCTPSSET